MAMNGPKVGHKCKLYRNSGTYDTASWTLISEIGDVALDNFMLGLAELKRRANNYTKNLATLFQSITLSVDLIHGLGATQHDYLRTAFLAQTPFEMLIADGLVATTNTQGFRCPFIISEFPWDQPLEEVSKHAMKLAIAYMEYESASVYYEMEPSWLVSA